MEGLTDNWVRQTLIGGWSEDKKLKEIGTHAQLALAIDLEGE